MADDTTTEQPPSAPEGAVLVEMTSEIVGAYVRNNHTPSARLDRVPIENDSHRSNLADLV